MGPVDWAPPAGDGGGYDGAWNDHSGGAEGGATVKLDDEVVNNQAI